MLGAWVGANPSFWVDPKVYPSFEPPLLVQCTVHCVRWYGTKVYQAATRRHRFDAYRVCWSVRFETRSLSAASRGRR